MTPKNKRAYVMKEFQNGQLHSSNGEIVKNPRQAIAIAYSESGEKNYQKKQKDRAKADRFGMSLGGY
jgi:hypothetical protein